MREGFRLLLGLKTEEDLVQSATGLECAGKIKPADVILAGYPKSGNTWLQYMLADLYFGIDASGARDEVIQNLVPALDSRYGRYFRRYADPMVLRTHDFPRPEFRRVIYLIRDGRDVLTSYVNYLKLWKENEHLDPARMMESRFLGIPAWEDHVAAWAENPFGAEIHRVRYEDLKSDPAGELKGICEFIGMEVSPEKIGRAVEHSRFEVMREREKKLGWSQQNTGFPQEGGFVRRGEVGSYKDELSKKEQEIFLKKAEPMLRLHGYL